MKRTSLALALAVAAIPAIAGAQQSSTQQDSTRRNADRTTRSRGGDVDRPDRRTGNGGNRRFRGRNYGLDREQVRQLQEAIDDRTECNVGTADGVMGPKTGRALTCARRELGIQGNDMGELFTALGLDFASEEAGANAQSDSTQGNRANRANAGNRGNSRNRGNTGRDSTMRDSTMRDSTRGQSPGQQPPL